MRSVQSWHRWDLDDLGRLRVAAGFCIISNAGEEWIATFGDKLDHRGWVETLILCRGVFVCRAWWRPSDSGEGSTIGDLAGIPEDVLRGLNRGLEASVEAATNSGMPFRAGMRVARVEGERLEYARVTPIWCAAASPAELARKAHDHPNGHLGWMVALVEDQNGVESYHVPEEFGRYDSHSRAPGVLRGRP